jgi:ABC-type polysaccharide/polyol phosphate export permease
MAAAYRTATVYEPTVTGLPELRPYLAALAQRRRFMWHLARTDLKAEHYDTALGQLWVILDPLLTAAVYFLFRSVIRSAGSAADRNLLLSHLLWGVFFFTYTNNAITSGARSVLQGRNLILNASFPRALLPVVATLKSLLDFAPTLVVYFVLHAILGQPFALAFVYLPLLIVIQTVFNLGFGMILAPLMVFYRDTGGFLPYITRLWLYVTPVLYTVAEIPGTLKAFLRWNPLYPVFAALEQVFKGQFPSSSYVLAAAAWAVVTFVIGAVVFLARERDFAVRL